GGTGVLGAVTVFGGGIYAPGNSIGTQIVNGNFALNPGAIFEVEVNAAGQGDRVIVIGTVNLSGAVLRALAENGNYQPKTEYLIIDNDGGDAVIGTFSHVTTSLAFLTPFVNYQGGDGNDVVLTLIRNNSDFCSVAVTKNQCSVARALDQFPVDNPLYLAVLGQTAAGARQAFDALSGEIHATLPGVLASESRYVREAVLGRLTQATYTNNAGRVAALGTGGPQVASLNTNALDEQAMALGHGEGKSLAAPPPSYGSNVAFWTRAYGAWGDFDGNRNAASADRDLGGFLSGLDAQISGTWRAGLAAGGAWSNVSVGARRSHAEVESFNLAGYVGGTAGPLALRGGGSWTWSDID
ncbi:MAG: autotransporter outer membrane beta-barrel domain-containing protein, partial [Methyloceanibacter sp.]